MTTISVDLPNALKAKLELIATESGVSLSELLIDAADKLSQIDFLEKTKANAGSRNTPGFERVLASVPDVPPTCKEDIIQ